MRRTRQYLAIFAAAIPVRNTERFAAVSVVASVQQTIKNPERILAGVG